MIKITILGLIASGVLAGGCGVSTKAPPITGKPFPVWSKLTSDQKIALIESKPMPESAKQAEIAKIKAGQD